MRFPRMVVVIDQHHGFKPLKAHHRCRLQSYTHLDYYNIRELGQTNLAHSLKQAFEVANIHRSFSTPCLSLTTILPDEEFDTTNPRIDIVGGHGNSRVRALVAEVAISMALGFDPTPLSSGLGGAYLLHGRNGENIAVAKPVDEEPLAFNNPKGFGGLMLGQPGLKRSVRIGENGVRELAAYLLDHGGFASVPQTALVKISHVAFHVNNSAGISTNTPFKVASFQRFVDHDFDAGELGPSGFSVSSIHRIGIFDIRLLNLDRHAGNILVKKREHGKYAELVPIDHGLCLPEWLDDPYFEWLHWPQASVPFSEIEMEYVSNLDPCKDAELLRIELPAIREASIRILVLCTIFLKEATAAGLCLADMGKMMTREFCGGGEELSELENLCAQAMAAMPEDTSGNEEERCIEGPIESDQFEFDKETVFFHNNEVLEVPNLLQSYPEIQKAPQITEFSSAGSKTRLIFDKKNRDGGDCDMAFSSGKNGSDDKVRDNNRKAVCLTKSVSFAVHNRNCETGVIFLGEMSEDEWDLFLESFKKLLPEVFDATKCLSLKQRMGTSCKF